jgi:hypothetical protein
VLRHAYLFSTLCNMLLNRRGMAACPQERNQKVAVHQQRPLLPCTMCNLPSSFSKLP